MFAILAHTKYILLHNSIGTLTFDKNLNFVLALFYNSNVIIYSKI